MAPKITQGIPPERTMRCFLGFLLLLTVIGPASAADLCKENSFTKSQAVRGRWAYDSSCGLCHLYNLNGRQPGQFSGEIPSIGILDADYVKTLDGNGGMTPSLISDAFFKKWKDQKAFQDRVSNAIGAFPPKNYVKDVADAQIAAYILFEHCGKM